MVTFALAVAAAIAVAIALFDAMVNMNMMKIGSKNILNNESVCILMYYTFMMEFKAFYFKKVRSLSIFHRILPAHGFFGFGGLL
mmetsp:Transcript_19101/g.43247  ORF Transcript_19101/g.43247 Transcript_19101/m.43247 type:complete len:84 (+) Transcript_19101:345-596(+)